MHQAHEAIPIFLAFFFTTADMCLREKFIVLCETAFEIASATIQKIRNLR
jgi:hypothetical protein